MAIEQDLGARNSTIVQVDTTQLAGLPYDTVTDPLPTDVVTDQLVRPEQEVRGLIGALVSQWRKEGLRTENFEHPDAAVELLTQAALSVDKETVQPAAIVSPLCTNYETYRLDGQRYPTIHNEMIWQSNYGLRRGFLLLHEELPTRLAQLNAIGVPLQQVIVLVDEGMGDQLFTDRNPLAKGRNQDELRSHIDTIVEQNAADVATMIQHGLQQKTIDPRVTLDVSVIRLSELIRIMKGNDANLDFQDHWQRWTTILKELFSAPNNRWAGLMRDEMRKDRRYITEVWGKVTETQLEKRIIDQSFALVATVAEYLHHFHNNTYQGNLQNKDQVVLLDLIPGPRNPAHREFEGYNLPYTDGKNRPQTPILRPFHNLALTSEPAVPVPYLGKDLDTLQEEANKYWEDTQT